jgi:uncharacterized protein YqeY
VAAGIDSAYRRGVTGALRERLEADLRVALSRRDALRLSVLRTTVAAVSNAEAVDPSLVPEGVSEVPRRELGEDDVRRIVEQERDELRTTAVRMRRVGADDRARELSAQARVLDGFLRSTQHSEPVEDHQPVL